MNPNLHPEDQDELEIPESKLYVGMQFYILKYSLHSFLFLDEF